MTRVVLAFRRLRGLIPLLGLVVIQGCGSNNSNLVKIPPSETLTLNASVTLTPDQATQPEQIFLYSFRLSEGHQAYTGLNGNISITSQQALFNESLTTIAANTAGTCPTNGSVFPNYDAIYSKYTNLQPLQSFILKSTTSGAIQIPTNYTATAGIPVSKS